MIQQEEMEVYSQRLNGHPSRHDTSHRCARTCGYNLCQRNSNKNFSQEARRVSCHQKVISLKVAFQFLTV